MIKKSWLPLPLPPMKPMEPMEPITTITLMSRLHPMNVLTPPFCARARTRLFLRLLPRLPCVFGTL
jgi:hypothetical protein